MPLIPDDDELAGLARCTGPLLFMRGEERGRVRLSVVRLRADDEAPSLTTPSGEAAPCVLFARYGLRALLYDISLPAESGGWYALEGRRYDVATDVAGDLRLAFVSCNGQEAGDRDRPEAERNRLWERLAAQHAEAPLHLLLHGGDQIYADEILDAHPATRQWGRPQGDPGTGAEAAVPAIAEALGRVLLGRYLQLYGQRAPAHLLSRVPSLAMWDDHDICDGWGSLPDEKLDSPVGRTVFAVAREMFLLFQLGAAADALPSTCLDATGVSLGWRAALPGLQVIAPDLRSERRRERVMGPHGWCGLERALAGVGRERVLLLSSVPALGPRLSLVETLMEWTPVAEGYEDDLRDQWQSRSHRREWRRFLEALLAVHVRPGAALTVVSGEIHLATRATMESSAGPLHQLVASGITHPPPPSGYARALGLLARLGETPLPGHPIRLRPLPGRREVYAAQRNFLRLVREKGRWRAWWELEEDGPTPSLDLG